MNLQYVSASKTIDPHHSKFIQTLCKQLDTSATIIPKVDKWERLNSQGDWLISRSEDFLNKPSILNYWRINEQEEQARGPHMVIPNDHLPERVNNVLLAYSSYPKVEETFLRIGMDLALRFQAHLHCLKIVQPPQNLWSKREYDIAKGQKCYETIVTHKSISSGVLEYANDYDIDLICLLTRPWLDHEKEYSSSHSLKILRNSSRPVLLFREDDVQKLKMKIGA
jgi:hypothetical protein